MSAIQEDKEKKRQEIAKEKQRDRDKRLQQMQLKEIQDHEDLQRKIIQKQQVWMIVSGSFTIQFMIHFLSGICYKT